MNRPTGPPAASSADPTGTDRPVFGLMLLGGGLSGALVRDIRLANELADRGFPVHVWWTMDWPDHNPLRPAISQHHLFNGFRYRRSGGSGVTEALGRLFRLCYRPESKRLRSLQKRPRLLRAIMANFSRLVVEGVEKDRAVLGRLVRSMRASGVTHMLPMLAVLCPFVQAARAHLDRPVRYLVTFQGYELYINYARRIGLEEQLYQRFRQAVEQSDYPAVAVSPDYRLRVIEDVGIAEPSVVAIPPGVPVESPMPADQARRLLAGHFKTYDPHLPLVVFLGRQDTEKGIDLLLYAARILKQRGRAFQLAICGPTLFGAQYSTVMNQLATDLQLPVLWRGQVPEEIRRALFSACRCFVYPSIHREPFGMAPVEAVGCGAPAVVPDYGGVRNTITDGRHQAGLLFKVWDSGDLADQIERLLTDDDLHRRLRADGPAVAAHYSVASMADRLLAHLHLPAQPPAKET